MGAYNTTLLLEHKYGILSIYVGDLKELQKGRIPIGFETHAGMLREALPLFPDEERPKYQAVFEAGHFQAKFLRAFQTANALVSEEASRKRVIDDFLVSLTD